MRSNQILAVILGLAALAMCCDMEAHAGSTLSASQVRALFPGRFEAVWKEKRRVVLEADANGGLTGTIGVLSDTGRWWMSGSHLCISLNSWKKEKTRCGKVVASGGWYLGLFREDGTPRLRFRPE
jgi:hypothetical protein